MFGRGQKNCASFVWINVPSLCDSNHFSQSKWLVTIWTILFNPLLRKERFPLPPHPDSGTHTVSYWTGKRICSHGWMATYVWTCPLTCPSIWNSKDRLHPVLLLRDALKHILTFNFPALPTATIDDYFLVLRQAHNKELLFIYALILQGFIPPLPWSEVAWNSEMSLLI